MLERLMREEIPAEAGGNITILHLKKLLDNRNLHTTGHKEELEDRIYHHELAREEKERRMAEARANVSIEDRVKNEKRYKQFRAAIQVIKDAIDKLSSGKSIDSKFSDKVSKKLGYIAKRKKKWGDTIERISGDEPFLKCMAEHCWKLHHTIKSRGLKYHSDDVPFRESEVEEAFKWAAESTGAPAIAKAWYRHIMDPLEPLPAAPTLSPIPQEDPALDLDRRQQADERADYDVRSRR
jgi:hypothetical protein